MHGSPGGEGQVLFLVKEEEEEIAPQRPLRKSEDTEEKVWLLFGVGERLEGWHPGQSREVVV